MKNENALSIVFLGSLMLSTNIVLGQPVSHSAEVLEMRANASDAIASFVLSPDPLAACLTNNLASPLQPKGTSALSSRPVVSSDLPEFTLLHTAGSFRADVDADQMVGSTDLTIFFDGVQGNRTDVHRLLDPVSGEPTYTLVQSVTGVIEDIRYFTGENVCSQYSATSRTASELRKRLDCWFYKNLAETTRGKANVWVRPPVELSGDFHATKNSFGPDDGNPETREFFFERTTPVCLTHLGEYEPFTGDWIAGNQGELQGYYAGAYAVLEEGAAAEMVNYNNDFRVDFDRASFGQTGYQGWGVTDPVERYQINRENLNLAEVHNYFWFTDILTRLYNTDFIESLNLPDEIRRNLLFRQFRQDTFGVAQPFRYGIGATTNYSFQLGINFVNNSFFSTQYRRINFGGVGPLNLAYGYMGILDGLGAHFYWLQGVNTAPMSDGDFSNDANSFRYRIWPGLNDAFTFWVAFRYGQMIGDPEAQNIFRYPAWSATNLSIQSCGLAGTFAGHSRTSPRCNPKYDLALSTPMFDEVSASLKPNNNWGPLQVLPTPVTNVYATGSSPQGTDALGFFIASQLYDIAVRYGLGFERVDQILWKAVSMLEYVDPLPMRYWGHTLQRAARELWPDTAAPIPGQPGEFYSIFEDQVRESLLRRGIPVDSRFLCSDPALPNFQNAPNCCQSTAEDPLRCHGLGTMNASAFYNLNQPAPHRPTEPSPFIPVGTTRQADGNTQNTSQMERNPANTGLNMIIQSGFGTILPENHWKWPFIGTQALATCDPNRSTLYYDSLIHIDQGCGWTRTQNIYRGTENPAPTYTAYKFMKGSSYGPCDILRLSNIPSSGAPYPESEALVSGLTGPIVSDPESFFRACRADLPSDHWCIELTGDRMDNLVLMAPGNMIRFNRDRRTCIDESEVEEANILTDNSPPGWRVIQSVPEGFSFEVTRRRTRVGVHSYTLNVEDPSQTAGDIYEWQVTRYTTIEGTTQREIQAPVFGSTLALNNLQKDQPIEISLTRTRNGQTITKTWSERTNDLDRQDGRQFVVRVGGI